MAQHDYVIANGTGAAVRSDLNNALAAIVSQNSGATAPSTTYAYQWWADTTTGLLKLRNAANSGWITLFQLDGEWSTIALEDGTAAAPSIYFKDSGTDTGFYSPGADQVAISTGGSGRLFVNSTGLVGIGTSTPGYRLDVQDSINIRKDGIDNAYLYFNGTATRIGYNDGTGNLRFFTNSTERAYVSYGGAFNILTSLTIGGNVTLSGGDRSIINNDNNALIFGTNGTERARITSAGLVGVGTSSPTNTAGFSQQLQLSGNLPCISIDNTGTGANKYSLGVNSVGAFGIWDNTASAFRMYINSSGQVGIGTTSPSAPLHVKSTNPQVIVDSPDGSTESRIRWYKNGSTVGQVSTNSGNLQILSESALLFSVNGGSPSEAARIDSSGRLLVGTSSASTATDGQYSRLQIVGHTGGTEVPGRMILRRNETSANISISESIGEIYFGDNQAGEYALIKCEADNTAGSNDYPGRLVFSTTADGASSPTERFRIFSDGNARFANLTDVYPATDNAVRLGASGIRWSQVWAANGTIQTSDQRAKVDINTSTLGLDFIKSLRPVSYKWVEGGKVDTGERDEDGNYIYESVPGERTHWGFIAQEVKQAVDAAGVDFGGWVLTDKDDPDSQQALRYDQFIAPLTKALQEALEKIETLEAKVAALEAA